MRCLRDLMMIKSLNSCLRKTLSETMIFAANDRKFNSICNFSYDKELFVNALLMSWIIFWCLSDNKWVIILIEFRLIASSWVLEFELSTWLVKTRFESEFLIQVFELSRNVQFKYSSWIRELKLSINLKFSTRLVKTWR